MNTFLVACLSSFNLKKSSLNRRFLILIFLVAALNSFKISPVYGQCDKTLDAEQPFQGSAEDFKILCDEAQLVLAIQLSQHQDELCPPGCYLLCSFSCETLTLDEDGNFTAKALAHCECHQRLLANCSATPESEEGTSDGTATANVSGGTPPYTYHWSNNGSSSTIMGLTAGTYACDVTDAMGQTASCEAVVTVEDQCQISLSIMNPVVSKGQELNFSFMIHHRRLQTVTTPVYIAIYDQNGTIVRSIATEPYTFEFGDMITMNKSILIPGDLHEGTYYLKVGVGEMKQGTIKFAKAFQVIE